MEINDMPDEVLMMIFNKLPAHILSSSPAFVCRRWKQLITAQILVLRNKCQLDDLHHGTAVILAIHKVPSLHSPSTIISNAAAMAHRLRELTIHCKLPLDEMDYVVLKSTLLNLRYLDVFSKACVLNHRTVLAPSITNLVANDNMSAGFLSTLCESNKIKSLHMYGRSLHFPPRSMMKFIRTNCMHLTDITLRCTEMTDARFAVLSKCSALVSLRLYSCWLLTVRGVPQLTRPPLLRCLHVTGSRLVRHRALAAFIAELPPLIVDLNLSATRFSDEHCPALAARLPALRRLELWRCKVTAGALLELAGALGGLEELDTDVQFSSEQLESLLSHDSLMDLRCRLPTGPLRAGRVRVRSSAAAAGGWRRGDGDGPAADVFYRWAAPAPPPRPPS